jgi:hydroxyacylglutathione hydrolase
MIKVSAMIESAASYLMFQRFSDEGLAQNSYLIACDRMRKAAVIDPRRDIDVFVQVAERHGLEIVHAIETHTHADFVSGARALEALGAAVVAGPGADLEFPFHEVHHGETIALGDVALEILHTPGHTPEHISIVVREPRQPVRVLTGDTLFVGAVGRPDLLGADQAGPLAEALFDALFQTLLALDDDVEVHAGHGAGSLCGAGIGHAPHSTIGQERNFNPLLQKRDRATFVSAVLADLPDTPPYFPRMKRLNRVGPPLLEAGPIPALSAPAAAELVNRGALLVDLRTAEAFGIGHPRGALNIAFGPRVGYWAGWVVAAGAPIVLLGGNADQLPEAVRQLQSVGVDDIAGYVDQGYTAWRDAALPSSSVQVITARELRDRMVRREQPTIVDVRTPGEWRAGHVDEAINIPVSELAERAAEVRNGSVVATICESGFRSSLAASILLRAGGIDVVNVTDGTTAYRNLEPA